MHPHIGELGDSEDQAAVTANDADIDEAWGCLLARREIDREAAQVKALKRIKGLPQFLPIGTWPSPTESFEDDPSGDIGFELENSGPHLLVTIGAEIFLELATIFRAVATAPPDQIRGWLDTRTPSSSA